MKWNYFCPQCSAHLNPVKEHVVLLADCSFGRGLFMFSNEPGDYQLVLPKGISVEKGQLWDFYCPVCRADLKLEAEPNIAMIKMTDSTGSEHSMLFSRVAKERCTFVVNAEGVKVYGPDSINYADVLWNKMF